MAGLAGLALATAGLVAPSAFAEVRTDGAIIQPNPQADITQINVIGFNDFHGRINSVDQFAAGVLATRDAFGSDRTILLGSGDQVGASEFESAVQQDEPSIQALNAFGGNSVFVAGNHEFDGGFADARDRISTGLDGGLLAANITLKADGSLPFEPYRIVTIDGVDVAIIGAVTASTASLVSPDGVADIEFGDMVAAVNKYADMLTDGDAANGEADVVIASYHEGGPDNGSWEQNLGNEIFASMVNGTNANVDAIFMGHTHRLYAFDAPVPGVDGKTRPVVQASEYGTYIGQLVLDVDANGDVVAATSSLIETKGAHKREDLSPESQAVYDRIVEIKTAALESAEELGAVQIGVLNTDVSRGAGFWENGVMTKQDNRGQESSLGTIIADSMNIWAQHNTTIGSDLSMMNPGGMRAPLAGDGVITYKDAQLVLPFTNNLTIIELKGADVKAALENQWQRQADGTVPSRDYLQLGLSSNVQYTYDATQDEGSRITSVTVDGAPLDFDKVYRVTMPSFLAAGGDNFHAFNNAVVKHDTGWLDLDAFKAYLASLPNTELIPDELRNGFSVEGYFPAAGAAGAFPEAPQLGQGESLTFTVKDVDLHSLGHIANTSIVATINGVEVGTADITGVTANGEITSAELTITIPEGVGAGAQTLRLEAQPSGSYVELPITVKAPGAVSLDRDAVAMGGEFTVKVDGFADHADQQVTATLHSTPIELGPIQLDADGTGSATFTVPADAEPGDHRVVVTAADGTQLGDPALRIAGLGLVGADTVTTEESAAGIDYVGAGWLPGVDVQLSVILPDGTVSDLGTVPANDEGLFSGTITWATYDADTGEIIEDNQPFPPGTYRITATQGDITAEIEFTVTGAPVDGGDDGGVKPIETTKPAVPGLAATGADSTLVVGGLALALLLAAAGVTLVARRTQA